jgi:hypothetical protein
MRSLILSLFFVLLFAGAASAQQQYALEPATSHWVPVQPKKAAPALFEPDDKLRLFGFTVLIGLPDGIAPGISFHPWTNLLHIDVSLSGLLSLGFRAGVTVDPFDWIVAPTLTLATGYNGWADAPFVTGKSVRFTTTYVNLEPGIEVGRRSKFRLFLRLGYSHVWIDTDYRPSYSGKQATSSTQVRVGLFPALNFGLTGYL